MDIVDMLAKTLQPEETPAPEKTPTGEYITKGELENIIEKMTETLETKFSAAIKAAQTADTPKDSTSTQPTEADTHTEE